MSDGYFFEMRNGRVHRIILSREAKQRRAVNEIISRGMWGAWCRHWKHPYYWPADSDFAKFQCMILAVAGTIPVTLFMYFMGAFR